MDHAHAFLQSAWEDGDDPTVLLIFADFLDERGDASIAELLRLLVADSRTARDHGSRATRLKELRADAWKSIRGTAWPDMAVQGHAGPASFSRRPDLDRAAREIVVVRPDRRSIHWLRVNLEVPQEWWTPR